MPFFDDQLPLGEFDFGQFARTIANEQDIAERARLGAGRAARFRAATLSLDKAREAIDTSETDRVIEAGIEAARILTATPDALLDDSQKAALEAVVRVTERPALIIKDDTFAEPPLRWNRLHDPHRPEIQKLIPSVGRIESTTNGKTEMIGTGFVVASDLIMTNTHVVEDFADPAPDYSSWSIRAGANPVIDFKAEHESLRRKAFGIKRVVAAFDRRAPERLKSLDLALLQVETSSFDTAGEKLPHPLELAKIEPANLFVGGQPMDGSRDIYLVGYPWTDNEGVTPPEILNKIFGGILKIKRLQPGEYGANFPGHLAFSHDSATLGGNSGSFVADLSSALIIGLHFKGKYKQANYALQLWTLQDLPCMQGKGLNFTD